MLLSHYVGDIHQPLHVSAVYLNARGNVVDPDQGTFDPRTKTVGGNSIFDNGTKLHHAWDQVPNALKPDQLGVSGIAEAQAIPPRSGDIITWPAQWATDTMHSAAPAFAGATFSAEDPSKHWEVTLPPNYASEREIVQRTQLLKAGARLAQPVPLPPVRCNPEPQGANSWRTLVPYHFGRCSPPWLILIWSPMSGLPFRATMDSGKLYSP